MYTFEDRDSRSNEASDTTKLTLRPEGTAGVVRAYVEAEMYKVEPVRKRVPESSRIQRRMRGECAQTAK